MAALGKHCLLELYGCPPKLLNDREAIRVALQDAAQAAGATWLGEVSHKFEPQGVTALGLLAESHVSMHTWPENGFAAVDVFTCGDVAMPQLACEHLIKVFRPQRHSLREIARGCTAEVAETTPAATQVAATL